MAEVRLCFRRGTYNFAHKICNRYLFESQNKQIEGSKHASSLSAGLILDNFEKGGLYGAGKMVTVGLPHNSYTRVTRLFGTVDDILGNRNVTRCNYFERHKLHSRSYKCQVGRINKATPRYRINARFQRTFCSFRSAHPKCGVGLCCGQFMFIRPYSGNGTRDEPLYKTKTGYYDVLEVSPAATHSQIKTAYYKQSFVYHPDRNSDSEDATARFSEISEAYAVLGNKALRKKYDRGLLSQSDLIVTAKPSAKDTGSSAKQPTESRRSVLDAKRRKEIFDFDSFIKNHYSEQLQRERDIKARREEMLRKKHETIGEKKLDRMLEMGVLGLLALAVFVIMSLKRG